MPSEPTRAELWADYARCRRNLRRLAQLATVQERRAQAHGRACADCRAGLPCIAGTEGRTKAVTLRAAVDTIKGRMVWQ